MAVPILAKNIPSTSGIRIRIPGFRRGCRFTSGCVGCWEIRRPFGMFPVCM